MSIAVIFTDEAIVVVEIVLARVIGRIYVDDVNALEMRVIQERQAEEVIALYKKVRCCSWCAD